MEGIIKLLDGKKSYIGAALIALAAFLEMIMVDPSVTTLIRKIGEALFGIGIASKLVKVAK